MQQTKRSLMTCGLKVLVAVMAFLAAPGMAQAQFDTTPPEIVGFSIDPGAIDVTSTSQTVTVTLQVTDDLSGVSYGYVYFVSPDVGQRRYVYLGFPVAGDRLNGTWQAQFTFPKFVDAGTWRIDYVYLRDVVGNTAYAYTNVLAGLGFPTDLEVTSNEDVTPPEIVSLTLTPDVVDVSGGNQTVTARLQIRDATAGVDMRTCSNCYTTLNLRSPTAGQDVYVSRYSFSLVGGNFQDGTWEGSFTIPRYSEAGEWQANYLYVEDLAGNLSQIRQPDLGALLPDGLTVNSDPQDVEPPQLVDLEVVPTFIDTTASDANVTVTFTFTDNLAGVGPQRGYTRLYAGSPSGQNRSALTGQVTSGTSVDGVTQQSMFFPQYSEDGNWKLTAYLQDETDNILYLSDQQLEALGLPSTIVVVRPSLDVDDTVDAGGGTIVDDTFGDRAQVTVPAGAVAGSTDVAIDVFENALDLDMPQGFAAPGSHFVNIEFNPEPAFPLGPPGIGATLPLPSPQIPGTQLALFKVDPNTGDLIPAIGVDGQPVVGTVNADTLSASFSGIASLSTVVGLLETLVGDFNGDDCVDRDDYRILITDVRNGEPNDPAHDLNEDGVVNRADARTLVTLFSNPRGTACE